MLVCLMRHGQTDWNAQHRMQGLSDIPLNETGLTQVRQAAGELADTPFDRIFSSPLMRARQTAEILALPRGLTVEVEPLLTELSFGVLEGTALDKFPQELFTAPEMYVPPERAESFDQLDARCGALLDRFLPALEQDCSSVLLCSHGAFINGVIRRVTKRPVRDFWLVRQENCERTWLRCQGGDVTLIDGRT
ncbi:MAG: histidine phosphatase family protein [Oscillospiraceae bacterium]|nr:histidine phosphatase family protein [Oscillospiraceae bacterium]